ncbi:hypothetical protein VNI00_016263 [Paramarasmius palmivorus]|uniref:Uncharacterized protein n=1 Tax=Paramarasmius palmivorus TaxID=297713 RepID=A0AAW0BEI7_9AGAR
MSIIGSSCPFIGWPLSRLTKSAQDDDYEDEEEDPATTDFHHGPSNVESDASEDPNVERETDVIIACRKVRAALLVQTAIQAASTARAPTKSALLPILSTSPSVLGTSTSTPVSKVTMIEGILGTLASIQHSLDVRALAEQGLHRGQRELERRRVILKRSTRDPRILCALLRLVDPSQDTLDPDRLSMLLTALQVRHSTFDIEAAGFQFTEDKVQIVDKSRKVLAAYHPRELFMDSLLPWKPGQVDFGMSGLLDVPSSLPPRIRGAGKDIEEPVVKDKSSSGSLQPLNLSTLCQALRTGSLSPARYPSKEKASSKHPEEGSPDPMIVDERAGPSSQKAAGEDNVEDASADED